MKYEVVIGIEVHAQLKTHTKLFSTASNAFGKEPNSNVTTVCLGMPGALPVLNKQAVVFAIQAGLALDCQINQVSVFSRKNYFYPDLPKGYQISQFDQPICVGGFLDVTFEGHKKRIGITRIHMEEDAGKLLHQGADGIAGSTHSFVDLNRAGTPLIEIVSEPDIRSATEAKLYVETLRDILIHVGVSDGNMDEGNLRADANVSIRLKGETALGTRTEIKNLNSFRSIERAINGEVKRQIDLVESGEVVVQETRNYDDATQMTTSLRSKEDAHDYRYFPEPDLPPLVVSDVQLNALKKTLPELPQQKRERYFSDFGLSDFEIKVLIGNIDIDRYFRETVALDSLLVKPLCKWIVGDLNRAIRDSTETFLTTKVTPKHLVRMVQLIDKGTISGKMGKELLIKMIDTGNMPDELVKQMGGGQISDESELVVLVNQILDDNLDVVEKIKNGKHQAAGFLMGQIMKASKGKAQPDLVNKLIFEQISVR